MVSELKEAQTALWGLLTAGLRQGLKSSPN